MLKREEQDVALVVAELADIEAGLQKTGDEWLPRSLQERVRVARTRLGNLLSGTAYDGAPLSLAADYLNVSVPTVRTWIERDVLVAVPRAKPAAVSLESLLRVRRIVDELRARGQDRDWLQSLVDHLHDEQAVRDPAVQRGLDELRRGDLEPA
jgi:hypothetical protein